MAELPGVCHESSGLEVINDNLFITHNDGGDEPNIYFLDSSGQILRTVFVQNVTNKDWEDITVANDGSVFIGNFGNNSHNRKDLEILILPKMSEWNSDTVIAETITYSYTDQNKFPPPSANHVFDCESIAFYKDSLYIFNKNWTSPFNGMVKMYVMPAKPGNYQLSPVDSVNLGNIRELGWVTGADIEDSTLYLVGSATVWKFSFNNLPSLKNPEQINLNHFSQKEAISVLKGNIFITDESTGGFGNLYHYGRTANNYSPRTFTRTKVKIIQTENAVSINNPDRIQLTIQLKTLDGKFFDQILSNDGVINIDGKNCKNAIITPGVYVLHIVTDKGEFMYKKVFAGR
jgi:hypothetical protein